MRTCYNLHMSETRGVAYAFWLRVRAEQAARSWTDDELRARSGVARTTIDRLARGRRPPLSRVVNALAATLDIDQTEAHRLAGLLPADELPAEVEPRPISAREAIERDATFTEDQRRTLLQVLDLIEAANSQKRQAS